MKRSFLLFLLIFFVINLHAQRDTASIISDRSIRYNVSPEGVNVNLRIYPVPVRENYFYISSDKEITSVKITNIIGQDIFKENYNDPKTLTTINLDSPTRGMYLVTIMLKNGSRIVRKIMIERTE